MGCERSCKKGEYIVNTCSTSTYAGKHTCNHTPPFLVWDGFEKHLILIAAPSIDLVECHQT
jgi:hypothetical protein